jgi:CPA2 family monovalent cation:H+ antiporter-2
MLVGVVVVSLMLIRLRQSLLAGYFICGILLVNSGLLTWMGGEDMQNTIDSISEFGVLLLMFTLGLEFSLSDLKYLKVFSFVGGSLHLFGIGVPVGLICFYFGLSFNTVFIISIGLTLSSTAVSVKSFQDLNLDSTVGARLSLAIAIFQDLIVIFVLLILPLLIAQYQTNQNLGFEMTLLFIKGIIFVGISVIFAKWLMPWLLQAVAKSKIRELFTLTVMGCCVGLAYVAGSLGLSLVLGAFVAGLAVSESIYKHRILTDILPIKDLFLTLFFVSVGLMIQLKELIPHWQSILWVTLSLITLKAMIGTLIGHQLGLAFKQALFAGVSLCSAGEFSLLLFNQAYQAQVWSHSTQQILLTSGALSMGLLPSLLKYAEPLGSFLSKYKIFKRRNTQVDAAPMKKRISSMENHAIICGYGPVGMAIQQSLQAQGIETLIIELNADTVHQLQRQGQAVLFADASHPETWELCRTKKAKLIAFSIPDATITAAAMSHILEIYPQATILARARFHSDVERLKKLGATCVINDEQESAKILSAQSLELIS